MMRYGRTINSRHSRQPKRAISGMIRPRSGTTLSEAAFFSNRSNKRLARAGESDAMYVAIASTSPAAASDHNT